MGLKTLLTDLQAGIPEASTIPGFMVQRSPTSPELETYQIITPHVIKFNNLGITWPDGNNSVYSNNQPFVRGTPPEWSFQNSKYIGDIDSDSVEYIRGGGSLASLRRSNDFERIGRFFGTPRGKGFLEQQMLLQLTNPRVDAPMHGMFEHLGGFSFLGGVPDPNQQTYNYGLNTQIQSTLSGLTHLPREGLIPFVHSGYADGVKKSNWEDPKSMANKESNRLIHLVKHKMADPGGFGNYYDHGNASAGFDLGGLGKLLNKLTGKGEELFSYLGGPDSLFGVGRTFHGRFVNSAVDNWDNYLLDNVLIGHIHADDIYTHDNFLSEGVIDWYDDLLDEEGYNFYIKKPGIQNYLITTGRISQVYDNKTNEQTTKGGFNYHGDIKDDDSRTYHRESRIGMGNPGRILNETEKYWGVPVEGKFPLYDKKGHINYRCYIEDKIDKINALDIVTTDHTDFAIPEVRDLVKFRFEAMNNDNLGRVDAIVFRAFIDDLADNYSAEHNEFKYNGRGEKFFTYKGFARKISLGFKIAAQSRWEMMPLYRKLNFLISNTAPDYSPTTGRMRTPFMRLTVGSWMNRIPGVINNINLKWQKDYPWEINLTGPEDEPGLRDMVVLPHVLDVTLGFTPVHNFLPRKSITEAPFILPNHHEVDGALGDYQKWLSLDSLNQTQKTENKKTTFTLDPQFYKTDERFNGGPMGTGL